MFKRGIFFRMANQPEFYQRVYQMLCAEFSDTPIDLVVLKPWIRQRPDVLLVNMLFVIQSYGRDIIQRKRRLKDSFFRTPYLFRAMRTMATTCYARTHYDFSFQLHSLFDASYCGVPHFVYTDHTHLANLSYRYFDPARLYAKAWIECERTIYQHARLIFTWSSHISRSLIEQYHCDPQKVVRVYAGSNTDTSTVAFNPAKYTSKRILFVGTDWERKGGLELVAAFKQVLAVHPDARLVIVGCMPQVDVVQCDIIGRIPLEQVSAFYEQCAIFCLPTKQEPFGIVFAEAMNHKLPIVACDVGAVPDFVTSGETGYMLAVNDIAGLARALIDLLDHPAMCRAYGERGYALAQERYSWASTGAAIKRHMLACLQQERS